MTNTSIIYTLLVGMAYTLTGTLALYWCAKLSPINGDMGVPLISVFIVSSCFGTIWNDLFSTKITELLGLTVSISLDDSATAGGA